MSFPQTNVEPDSLFFPRGAILGGGQVEDVDLSKIAEHVSHSWYNGSTARHPSAGETLPKYTGLEYVRPLQLAEGSALQGRAHGSRTPGACAGRIWPWRAGI